jgi:4-hydroxy-tetrahydrodipicolinate reductase
VKVAIIGLGKMGRAVREVAAERGHVVVAEIGSRGEELTVARLAGAEVAIEFTRPESAVANIRTCLAAGCPVVTGTTGWYDQLSVVGPEVERAGGALLWGPNFSVGAQILYELGALAGRLTRAAGGYAAQIVETHHAAKLDAPSGTAKQLARAIDHDVPITSVRVGHVPGTHTAIFDGAFDQIVVEHVVRDRRVFADGALTAAGWLIGKRGVFTMRDVLGAGAAT